MSKKMNLDSIQSAIQEDGLQWQAAQSPITELSADEFDMLLGYTPGPEEESLQSQEASAAANLEAFQSFSADDGFGAPSSFDLRNVGGRNYITSVKNQRNCGSCVAFGTIACAEGTLRWQKKSTSLNVDYSEAHLFYCHAFAQGRSCANGWWPRKAMEEFKSKGVVDEACFPYQTTNRNCGAKCSDWQNRLTKISGFTRLTSISAMKNWISTKGPLVACYTVYSDFGAYRSGVYRKSSGATRRGGHCVCVVGYNDVGGYWICKNSWGTGWGDNGYFKIAYGEVGIDSDMYGVNGFNPEGLISGKRITGLWASNNTTNAYAYISGIGWKKVYDGNETQYHIILDQLIAAKAKNRAPRIKIDSSNEIIEVYT